MSKKDLLIADYVEWYGPLYACPFCAEEKIWADFKFCPYCGGNLEGFGFETIGKNEKRMKKENGK